MEVGQYSGEDGRIGWFAMVNNDDDLGIEGTPYNRLHLGQESALKIGCIGIERGPSPGPILTALPQPGVDLLQVVVLVALLTQLVCTREH